jgi:hypothetical protein
MSGTGRHGDASAIAVMLCGDGMFSLLGSKARAPQARLPLFSMQRFVDRAPSTLEPK